MHTETQLHTQTDRPRDTHPHSADTPPPSLQINFPCPPTHAKVQACAFPAGDVVGNSAEALDTLHWCATGNRTTTGTPLLQTLARPHPLLCFLRRQRGCGQRRFGFGQRHTRQGIAISPAGNAFLERKTRVSGVIGGGVLFLFFLIV